MNTLREYWGRLFSRARKPSTAEAGSPAPAENLQREISAISGENQVLAEEVRRVRTEFERAREEEHRKIVDLQQVRDAMEHARGEELRKLAELEQHNNSIEAARDADSQRIRDLEKQLAGIQSERDSARLRVQGLEDSLKEAASRLERAEERITALQNSTEEQARQHEASLAAASSRLEATDNHVRELDRNVRSAHQEFLKTYQEIQSRFRKQDLRLNWTLMAAVVALLLGTVTGVILAWDVQRNSALLSSVSQDLQGLIGAIDEQLGQQQALRGEDRQQAMPATVAPAPVISVPAAPETMAAARPANRTAALPRPGVPSTSATINKPASNPYLLGSAFKNRDRAGIRHSTRDDAKSFFKQNAEEVGVVSLDSGVQYRVISPGSGKSPTLADRVVVSYVGIKPDGTVFDESYSSGEPVTFSMEEVMPGWQEVLLKMEEGAEFDLYLPPQLSTSGGTRKRSMLGFEPSLYRIELLEVIE